jgi:N-succinyldiaminopimelate aminotransferase
MPRPPQPVHHVEAIPEAVFSPWADRLREHPGPIYPLHVGDTWLEPFEGARTESLRSAEHPGLHRYSDTQGLGALIDAVVDKVRTRNRLPCERSSVLIAGGATSALAAAVGMLAAPEDEILILAPYWPLIPGIVRTFRGRPVEVPFYDRVESAEAAVEAVRERMTPRCVALYVSTPSNPTGRILPGPWLAALAEWARRENLWILSDEVYEELVYQGEHVSIGRFAPERTLSVFSFSKAYAMAGDRLGYLVGPPDAVAQIRKVTTRTIYAAPTTAQWAGLRALRDGGEWLERTRALYQQTGAEAARSLALPAPQGATYLFLDVRERLDERGVPGFLEACLEDGVLLAPGASSGADYSGWVRLCFTSCAPEEVREAVSRLATRLGIAAAASRKSGWVARRGR